MKKIVYRHNDLVKIINPSFVERVGYPLTVQKVKDEHFSLEDKKKIKEFLAYFSVENNEIFHKTEKVEKVEKEIIHALAKLKLSQLGWGGRERSLHYKELDYLRDRTVRIYEKRVVKTGTHYSARGGFDYWGEYDWEPGGLHDCKTHVLLGVDDPCCLTSGTLWIEEKNIEMVKPFNSNGS